MVHECRYLWPLFAVRKKEQDIVAIFPITHYHCCLLFSGCNALCVSKLETFWQLARAVFLVFISTEKCLLILLYNGMIKVSLTYLVHFTGTKVLFMARDNHDVSHVLNLNHNLEVFCN